MIKLKLLAFCAIVLGPCAFALVRAKRPVGRTLPAVVCAQSVALIGLGYVLPLSVSVGVLAGISGLSWAYALLRGWKNRRHMLSLAVSGGLLFLASVFLYDACASRLFLSYDEYSHWGILIKTIATLGELPRAGAGASYIQFTYPPATAMLPAMLCSLMGYRDGVAYLGYALLLLCLLWGVASRAGRGAGRALAFALLYLCLMAIFPLSILRLFVEPTAALLMTLLVLEAYEEESACRLETVAYALMLAMVKNTGLVFLALALAVRLVVRANRRELTTCAIAFGAGALGAFSYRLYCRAQGIVAAISPNHLGENLRALMNGTLSESYIGLPARFLHFLFCEPLPQSGVYSCYGFGTCAIVLGTALLLCAAHVLLAKDRRRALRLWGGVWVCNLLYLTLVVASYFVGFDESEVARLAEADRYTTLAALWTGLTACAMLFAEGETLHPRRRIAFIGASAIALLPLSHMEMTFKTFVSREYVHNTVWAREETGRTAAFIRSALPKGEAGRLLCMGGMSYIELHFELVGEADIGRIENSWEHAPWSGSCDAVRDALTREGIEHVFVGGLQSEDEKLRIDERYAPLTDDGQPLKENALYRVVQGSDGGARLCLLATQNDWKE